MELEIGIYYRNRVTSVYAGAGEANLKRFNDLIHGWPSGKT